jgi:DNA-directed RNA polymerase specialized sigma54-like protein
MKLSVNLKLNQSLKLTPLLQQSIKLLQASQNEINDLIEEYLKENIFLYIEGDNNNFNLLKTIMPLKKHLSRKKIFLIFLVIKLKILL